MAAAVALEKVTHSIGRHASPGVGSVDTWWIEGSDGIVVVDAQRQLSQAAEAARAATRSFLGDDFAATMAEVATVIPDVAETERRRPGRVPVAGVPDLIAKNAGCVAREFGMVVDD